MQKDYFFNGGGAPLPPLQFEQAMADWSSTWGCSQDQYGQFESMGAAAGGAAVSGGYVVRELIGKLGNVCSSPPPPLFAADMSASYAENNDNNVNNYNTDTSCFTTHTPLNPPRPPPPALSGGHRTAVKLSCLGSRSFNGRTGQFGLKNGDLPCRSNAQCIGNAKLPRISSSPSLKQAGSPVQNKNSGQTPPEFCPGNNPNDEFCVPDQPPTGTKTPTESNPRKRKPLSRRNAEEDDGKVVINLSRHFHRSFIHHNIN